MLVTLRRQTVNTYIMFKLSLQRINVLKKSSNLTGFFIFNQMVVMVVNFNI